MNATTNRRSLLAALVGLVASAWLPSRRATLLSHSAIDRVLSRLRGDPAALTVADAWNRQQSPYLTSAELRAAIVSRIGTHGEHLRATISDEFATGRTIVVDGWPVAESEAQLCALASLTVS